MGGDELGIVVMCKDDFEAAAAWLALIANGQISDYDLKRLRGDVNQPGDAKKIQIKMQQKMAEIMKLVNEKRAETN